MQLPDWLGQYGAVSGSAFLGSVANANGSRWRRADGRFDGWQIFTEGVTVVALAVGIVALSDYTKGILDLKVLCGLGVIGGWLGPQSVADFALKKLGAGKP